MAVLTGVESRVVLAIFMMLLVGLALSARKAKKQWEQKNAKF